MRTASGWSGDHWQLVEKDGRSAIVVRSTWDTPAAASDFFTSYARGLRLRFDSATTEESSVTRQALTTEILVIYRGQVLAVAAKKFARRGSAEPCADGGRPGLM